MAQAYKTSQPFRSTRVLTPDGLAAATMLVEGEKIAAIRAWNDVGAAEQCHDFEDLVLLPGLVDSHVHINDPGRAIGKGLILPRALQPRAALPLWSTCRLTACPKPSTSQPSKPSGKPRSGNAWVDWAAWGGVVRGNAAELPALAAGRRCRIQMLHDSLRHRRLCLGG